MYQTEHNHKSISSISAPKGIGIQIVSPEHMEKKLLRQALLLTGIVVALLVIVIINSAFISSECAAIETPANKVTDLVHYAVPNLILYLF